MMEYLVIQGEVLLKADADRPTLQQAIDDWQAKAYTDDNPIAVRCQGNVLRIDAEGAINSSDGLHHFLAVLQDQLSPQSSIICWRTRWEMQVDLVYLKAIALAPDRSRAFQVVTP